jgi:DNA-binding CsgD family transcriptional regulator
MLTLREIQVLKLMCTGLLPCQIAKRLGITTKTARQHRYNMTAKTGCSSSVQLGVWAAKQGIV